jgi:hypothetical protein
LKITDIYEQCSIDYDRGAVGATCRGIDYMRSLPELSEKQPTAGQLNQRAVLAMVSSWLKPLKALIWIGYQVFTGSKTPMNGAVSFHLKEAVTGTSAADYTIDFPKAVFSRRELLISLVKEVLMEIDGVLSITWDKPSPSAFCKADDKTNVIIYNPEKEFITFQDVAQRVDKRVDLQLPAKYSGDTVHIWMHYVNVEGNAVSTTQYLGEVLPG